MKPFKIILHALGISLLLVVCHGSIAGDAADSPPTTRDALAQVFSAPVTGKPVAIHEARETAKAGDSLTLTGRVMGNLKPFVEGRAAFILGDPEKLTPCNVKPGDNCKTPWDVCCDAPEDIRAATATIQVINFEGRVLREPIENFEGLTTLSTVIVSGTVAEGSNADVLILNAHAIDIQE